MYSCLLFVVCFFFLLSSFFSLLQADVISYLGKLIFHAGMQM